MTRKEKILDTLENCRVIRKDEETGLLCYQSSTVDTDGEYLYWSKFGFHIEDDFVSNSAAMEIILETLYSALWTLRDYQDLHRCYF